MKMVMGFGIGFLKNVGNIYVMDNHLGAAWSWTQECDPNKSYNFLHIDWHTDLNPAYWDKRFIEEIKNGKYTWQEFADLPADVDITKKYFRWNNFIMNMYEVYPNWLEKAIFITHDYLEEAKMKSGWDTRDLQFLLTPNVEGRLNDFAGNDNKWIVSFDLDYAYHFEGEDMIRKQIVDDFKIAEIAKVIDRLTQRGMVQTLGIALSPECCGGIKKAKRLYRIVSQNIKALNKLDI